jgi:hypothetical protein
MRPHWINRFGVYTERQVWDLEDTLTARINTADEVRITKRDIARIRAVCGVAKALPDDAPAVSLRWAVRQQNEMLGLILRKHEWRKAAQAAVRHKARDPVTHQFIKGSDDA